MGKDGGGIRKDLQVRLLQVRLLQVSFRRLKAGSTSGKNVLGGEFVLSKELKCEPGQH